MARFLGDLSSSIALGNGATSGASGSGPPGVPRICQKFINLNSTALGARALSPSRTR